MPLKWSEALTIDGGAIDDDHRSLIDLVNAFDQEVATAGIERAAGETLARLRQYTERHFRREEALQRRVGYPLAERHAQEHRELLRAIDGLSGRLAEAGGEAVGHDLSALLSDWLARHIVGSDLDMAPYAASLRAAQRSLPPLDGGGVRHDSRGDAPGSA
jgi:hemerythrin-like metal-binding protein